MEIRPARSEDAAACAAIYRPYVTDNWVSFELDPPDAAEMARRIAAYGEAFGWLIAEAADGAVLGYAYACSHRSREAYSTSVDVAIYVADHAQGQGLGRALYTALFERLRQRGFHAAFAGIAIPNPASEAWAASKSMPRCLSSKANARRPRGRSALRFSIQTWAKR